MLIVYGLIALGFAQEVSLHVQQDKLYSGMPFVLTVLASDFEEEPLPEVLDFTIDGCEIQFLGVDPQISRQMSIINGNFSESKDVKYAYRYRILAAKKGNYQIPPVSVTQAGQTITTSKTQFSVQEVPQTSDMDIEVSFAEGTYWVGQEIPVYVDLYLRKDIADQEISVPLFDIFPARPGANEARTVGLLTKFGELHLPMTQEKVNWKGQTATRIRLSAISALDQAGYFDIEPAKIFADVAVRQVQRSFGRPRAQYALYQAIDKKKTLVVKPLPMQNRPEGFSGAVGEGFSLFVSASRTVVSVGEPIALQFIVKGSGILDGLQLPSLEAMGLDSRVFSLPTADIIGMNQEDGTKKYEFNVQLKSTVAREIPALEFPFFNPKLGTYQLARSEPIALSVKETEQISSADVFSARERTASPLDKPNSRIEKQASIGEATGVDLSLSTPETSLNTTLDVQTAGWISALGHLLCLFLLGFLGWWSKGKDQRQEKGEKNSLVHRLHQAIKAAEGQSAAQSAKELGGAIRAWEKEFQVDCRDELAQIEIESFAPQAGTKPLSSDILKSLAEKIKTGRQYLLPFVLFLGFGQLDVHAEENSLAALRAEYQQNLGLEDQKEKQRAFSALQLEFRKLVQQYPESPALLTDWGNSALGASDLGAGAFAYHRALELNPRLSRARQNSLWIESQLPDWAQSTASVDPLLWGKWLSKAERLFLLLFSFMLLCLTVYRKHLNLSILFVLLWFSLGLSFGISWTQPPVAFVCKADAILRVADSNGASAALGKEIPVGTKVQILKQQGDWFQVSLASGQKGWLSTSKLLHHL